MAWNVVANVKGPKGDQGERGLPGTRWFFGPDDPGWPPEANTWDFYLNTTSGDVFCLVRSAITIGQLVPDSINLWQL